MKTRKSLNKILTILAIVATISGVLAPIALYKIIGYNLENLNYASIWLTSTLEIALSFVNILLILITINLTQINEEERRQRENDEKFKNNFFELYKAINNNKPTNYQKNMEELYNSLDGILTKMDSGVIDGSMKRDFYFDYIQEIRKEYHFVSTENYYSLIDQAIDYIMNSKAATQEKNFCIKLLETILIPEEKFILLSRYLKEQQLPIETKTRPSQKIFRDYALYLHTNGFWNNIAFDLLNGGYIIKDLYPSYLK